MFVVVHSLHLFKLHFAYYEQVLFRIEKIMNPRNRKTAKLSRHKGYSETNANVFIHISVTLWRVLSVANNTSFLVGMCFSCRSPPKAHVHTVFLSHHPTTQLPKQSYILSGSLVRCWVQGVQIYVRPEINSLRGTRLIYHTCYVECFYGCCCHVMYSGG